MSYALGLLVFWLVLFAPIGLGVHWLVLGESGRRQALPMAPITGLAVALVALGSVRQFGMDPSSGWVATAFVAAAVGVGVAVWRRRETWRSRELWGAGVLLVLAVVLFGGPLIDRSGIDGLAGPVGYGTGFEPVEQVATIDAALQGDTASLPAVVSALASADERYTGFEMLGAFTVGVGGDIEPTRWSPYVLYGVLLTVLASLTTLPLFVLGRWRGMRWYGLLAAVLMGVVSPIAMVALGYAHGPGVAATPFVVGAAVAVLVARRDRGWYAVAAVEGAAAMVIVGPLVLLPLIGLGVTWRLVQKTAHEHLAHTDVPVTRDRPLIAVTVVAMFAIHATIGALLDGHLLEWEGIHDSLGRALTSTWPLVWIGSGLRVAGPESGLDWALAATAPLLLALAVARGLAKRETRELAMVVGAVFGMACGVVVAGSDRALGIALVEVSLLTTAPLLAVVCVRTVGRVREQARENQSQARLWVAGPLLALCLLLVASVSTSGVTGGRMVHAPELTPSPLPGRSALIAVGDPWLSYEIDGERAKGNSVDADLMFVRGRYSDKSLLYGEYEYLVLDTDPMSSDPTGRYAESSLLDGYSVRLFADTRRDTGAVDAERPTGQTASASAGSARRATVPQPRVVRSAPTPRRHTPVEPEGSQIGGVLVPFEPIPRCTLSLDDACDPKQPMRESDCTDDDLRRLDQAERADLARARRSIERDRARAEADRATSAGGAGTDAGAGADTSTSTSHTAPKEIAQPLLGVACWTLPLDDETKSLLVHVKDVGVVLSPRDAITSPRSADIQQVLDAAQDNPFLPGDRFLTSDANTEFKFGSGLLADTYDVTVEGRFAAGIDLQTDDTSGAALRVPLRASAGNFSQIFRERTIFGDLTLVNSNAADVSVGRVFVRPTNMARSCDLVVRPEQDAFDMRRIGFQDSASAIVPARSFGVVVSRVVRPKPKPGSNVLPQAQVRLVFGNHRQHRGAPSLLMLDWVEQYDAPPRDLGHDDCMFDSNAVTDKLPPYEEPGGGAQDSTASAGGSPGASRAVGKRRRP